MFKHIPVVSVCLLLCCAKNDEYFISQSLERETHHFFSSLQSKDHFLLEFVGLDTSAKETGYSYFDILSGNLRLTIRDDKGNKIYSHVWAVSDCYSMADNHYLSVDQKIAKFLAVVDHFFDESNFNSLADLAITGILQSSDDVYRRDIATDSTSIGFSFIQEDFCVMFSKKFQKAVLLRALKKDLLKKYNLLDGRRQSYVAA
jgi:hypothetical protein